MQKNNSQVDANLCLLIFAIITFGLFGIFLKLGLGKSISIIFSVFTFTISVFWRIFLFPKQGLLPVFQILLRGVVGGMLGMLLIFCCVFVGRVVGFVDPSQEYIDEVFVLLLVGSVLGIIKGVMNTANNKLNGDNDGNLSVLFLVLILIIFLILLYLNPIIGALGLILFVPLLFPVLYFRFRIFPKEGSIPAIRLFVWFISGGIIGYCFWWPFFWMADIFVGGGMTHGGFLIILPIIIGCLLGVYFWYRDRRRNGVANANE